MIVGVTGSAGKSSAVAGINAILSSKYKVKTTGGANSESGIPLSILGLKMEGYGILDWGKMGVIGAIRAIGDWKKYDILVAEMGVDEPTEPKNMGFLLKILRPKVGVFLNVYPAHTEQFGNLAAIAAEKGKLIESLPKGGTAVLNADDPKVLVFKDKTAAQVVTFGRGREAQVKNFLVEVPGYALATDYGYTFAAAAAVGTVFGIDVTESRKLLAENLKLPAGRMSVLAGVNGATLLDSSYNASPAAMLGALDLLKNYPGKRKIAVLGDMRELGAMGKEAHKLVAQKALDCADAVMTVGPLWEKYFPKSPKLLGQFKSSFPAGEFLLTFLKKGDTVLFKGSQNTIFLEAAVEKCLADKADAIKLCRRGEYWKRQRQKFTI